MPRLWRHALFERAEVKDALAYLRLVANRHDDAAFERASQPPPSVRDRRPHPGRGAQAGARTAPLAVAGVADRVRRRPRRAQSRWPGSASCSTGDRDRKPDRCHCGEARPRAPRAPGCACRRERIARPARFADNLDELVSVASALRARRRQGCRNDAGAGRLPQLCRAGGGRGRTQAGEGRRAADDAAQRQGLEFPLVCLVGLEKACSPTCARRRPGRMAEEALAYVGITRARQQLVLCHVSRGASMAATCTACPRASCARSPANRCCARSALPVLPTFVPRQPLPAAPRACAAGGAGDRAGCCPPSELRHRLRHRRRGQRTRGAVNPTGRSATAGAGLRQPGAGLGRRAAGDRRR